jgi:hypothetical protein
MKDSNKCEAPLGGGGIDVCDKFDKNGKHTVGIGKAVADVTYYNKSQGEENTWTYACCKECTEYYHLLVDSDDWEDNTVVKIQYYAKDKQISNVDHTKKVILVSDK